MPPKGELLVRKIVATLAAVAVIVRMFVLAVVAGDGPAIAIVSAPSAVHAACIGQLSACATPIVTAAIAAAATDSVVRVHRAWVWMHVLERLKAIIGVVRDRFSNRGRSW